jgi:hypothetical protein
VAVARATATVPDVVRIMAALDAIAFRLHGEGLPHHARALRDLREQLAGFVPPSPDD